MTQFHVMHKRLKKNIVLDVVVHSTLQASVLILRNDRCQVDETETKILFKMEIISMNRYIVNYIDHTQKDIDDRCEYQKFFLKQSWMNINFFLRFTIRYLTCVKSRRIPGCLCQCYRSKKRSVSFIDLNVFGKNESKLILSCVPFSDIFNFLNRI